MHGGCRHCVGRVVVARTGVLNAFIAEQEEGLVVTVVEFWDLHRTTERAAPAVEQKVRTRRACLVEEEVVRPETRPLERVVRAAMKTVRAALDADVGDAALRLSE